MREATAPPLSRDSGTQADLPRLALAAGLARPQKNGSGRPPFRHERAIAAWVARRTAEEPARRALRAQVGAVRDACAAKDPGQAVGVPIVGALVDA